MTRIIGMTVNNAIAVIKEMNKTVVIQKNHDDITTALTIGSPFVDHDIAVVENDIVVDIKKWVW